MALKNIVLKPLSEAQDYNIVQEIIAADATYVSLNQRNPDLTKIEPWCGTHENGGPKAVHETFVNVNKWWETELNEIDVVLEDGRNVAVFGRFRFRSRSLGHVTASPFSVLAKFHENEDKISYVHFMEDTFSTAASFKKSGSMVFTTRPDGGEVTVDMNDTV